MQKTEAYLIYTVDITIVSTVDDNILKRRIVLIKFTKLFDNF